MKVRPKQNRAGSFKTEMRIGYLQIFTVIFFITSAAINPRRSFYHLQMISRQVTAGCLKNLNLVNYFGRSQAGATWA